MAAYWGKGDYKKKKRGGGNQKAILTFYVLVVQLVKPTSRPVTLESFAAFLY